jgi:hypothetical protein
MYEGGGGISCGERLLTATIMLTTLTFSAALSTMPQASFVFTGSIPIGMDKYNKKIMIVTIRDPDLFRVEN